MIRQLVCACALVFSGIASAAPAEVLIIRHAEKPKSGPHLNDRGRQRAEALVKFFETSPAMTRFGTPVAIYGAAPKKDGGSVRSIETVTPLAKDLGLDVDQDYTKKEVDDAAREILHDHRYDGKMVLLAWEHKKIPDLAAAFGADDAPDEWNGDDVFDRVWVLDFDDDGNVASFRDLPQHLLPGDSER